MMIVFKRILISLLLLSGTTFAFSQNDITGTWYGLFLQAETDLGQPKLVVEIFNMKDSMFTGVSHLYYKENKYEHYKIVGWYNKKDGLIMFREVVVIAVDLGQHYNCLGLYVMKLRRDKTHLFQDGYWEPNIEGCTDNTKVWLQKEIVEPSRPVPLAPKKPSLKPKDPAELVTTPRRKPLPSVDPAPDVRQAPELKNSIRIKPSSLPVPVAISKRETDLQSLLEISSFEKDSIKVDVYDNGDIDGDSVSVYEDNLQRVNKKMISTRPITFYVSLDKNVNPIVHLRLVAESLGSIPPCTALMIVTTRNKRYEVRLSSNFNKNATVELFLKE